MKYIIVVASSDCVVSFFSFCGTEKEMLKVLAEKADERRQALTERLEHMTGVKHDTSDGSWYINILSDESEVLETITAKSIESIECLNEKEKG